MKNIYNTLGFTIHRACNASCDICCFSSGPDCQEKLNVSRIKEYIDESKSIEEITTIAFTGGEPFLDYNLLVDLIQYAKSADKKVNTVTNGYWASNYEKAYERLAYLKGCGLDYLSLSHDAYHKKYIKTENIRNILRATTKLEIPTSLAIVKIKDEKIGTIIDEIGNDIYTASIKVGPCLPVGRASESFSDGQFDRSIETDKARCAYGGNLVICYDGTIYPCCSQVIVNTGLGIGNFVDISLKEAMKKLKNNALLYFLRNADMKFYSDFAKENLGMDIPDRIVNPCELCAILFKKDNVDSFYEYVMENIKIVKQRKAVTACAGVASGK